MPSKAEREKAYKVKFEARVAALKADQPRRLTLRTAHHEECLAALEARDEKLCTSKISAKHWPIFGGLPANQEASP